MRQTSGRLAAEEQQQALQAIARVQLLRSRTLAERGGKLFPNSAKLINQSREERTRALVRTTQE